MKKLGIFFCLTLITPALLAANLQVLLGQFQSMTADFSQTSVSQGSSLVRHASGTVSIVKPNRFRWQVLAPSKQLYVCDGKTLWTYEPALLQVIVRPLKNSFTGTPLLLLSGKVGDTLSLFSVQTLGHEHFLLTPKPSPNNLIKWVRLSFSGKVITTMVLENTLGQVTTVVFSHVQMNPSISLAQFTFNPPKGVDVLKQ